MIGEDLSMVRSLTIADADVSLMLQE